MLRETLTSVERQMLERLREIRRKFRHAGDKGATVEEVFRDFLREYLPRRLAVGHGEIIDTNERRSGQTDVVIVNDDHPFTFTNNHPGVFFIEGVSAAGEIKTVLNSSHLQSTLTASEKYKTLRVNHSRGTMIHANESDRERFYSCPPYFMVAFESELKLPAIVETIRSKCPTVDLRPYPSVDAVFVLNEGWAINFGDGKGAYQYQVPSGASHQGWACQRSESAIFDCLAWLSAVMPRMIRYHPIIVSYMVSDEPPFGHGSKGD